MKGFSPVSTATASAAPPLLGAQTHFLIRRLHSLTGIVFGGYLVVHLIVNATISQGGHTFQQQVDKIHSLPFLWALEWGLIFLPILFHTVYGVWITVTGVPNVNHYPYTKNWFYLCQRISAVLIVLFMVFHVLSLKYGLFGPALAFDPDHATHTVARHMQAYWWVAWIVYPLGVTASCFHLANGFWAAAITWGLTVSAAAQKRWGYMCAGLFVVTMVLGFTALISAARH